MLRSAEMSSDDPAADEPASSGRSPARLSLALLVAAGLSLIGAGALVWWSQGATVYVGNPILAFLAWCF
jgi:hypothetical protein